MNLNYNTIDYDVKQFAWDAIDLLKDVFKSDDDEILQRGHILSGERFNTWTFLRIPMAHFAYEIQSHLRHDYQQAKAHIQEVKESAGYNVEKQEDDEWIENLIQGKIGIIDFATGMGYHPEIYKFQDKNPFCTESYEIAVHYWEDWWSRINRPICHVVGAALVMKEFDGAQDVDAAHVLKLLDTNRGIPKFKYLDRIHEHQQDSMNTMMREIIDGEYLWISKVDNKKSLKNLVITPKQKNHFPRNYFASQVKAFVEFYREIAKKRGTENIPVVMENILKKIFVHVTMSDERPEFLDPTRFANQDKKVDLTEESNLQTRVFERIRLKDTTQTKENHERHIATRSTIEKLFQEVLKSKPATIDSLRKILNPIYMSLGIDKDDKFLQGADAIKHYEDLVVAELKNKFKKKKGSK